MKKLITRLALWIHRKRFHKKPNGPGRYMPCQCGEKIWVPVMDLNKIRKMMKKSHE